MNHLSCDIEKLKKNLENLKDLEVEQLFVDHIQKSLNALDELQRAYQNHYTNIIRTLLKQILQQVPKDNKALRQKIVFLEKLITQSPSLRELETLNQGIVSLAAVNPLLTLVPADQVIGDVPATIAGNERRAALSKAMGNPDSILEKIDQIHKKNEQFGEMLDEIVAVLNQSSQMPQQGSSHELLLEQAKMLTEGQRHLAHQLELTKQQLTADWLQKEQLSQELERTRALSLTDELTGLPNRRAFMQRMEEEIGRVQRYHFPTSLALIDLDHFKDINDQYGHAVGDQVLQMYAKHVLSAFRRHDHIARFGGEEFVVLLPNTNTEGARKALLKIRMEVSSHCFQSDSQSFPLPTFSAGIAVYHPDESITDFIERADQALYRAKKAGRDRIELAD